ncbi:hypothetical protein [Proteiniclasticum sp. QWL-01]|uniref:hypothetical protein n=1 Tax=Proteiniclasticum sp. QWL-01 TaxID=3036945 RepID=UPI002410B2E0|nr:hypothetical protein [Proteiniclasticum sp. QWL-01]WFF72901.1 hypothetical protein P6M73_00035 [Proteiniclasticum sp. QWL-01]
MTSAILSALKLLGKSPIAFKCGPDFHRSHVSPGGHGDSLPQSDLFLMKEATVRSTLHNHGCQSFDLSLIEGVMGLYDWHFDDEGTASANAVSLVTGTPGVPGGHRPWKRFVRLCRNLWLLWKFMPNRCAVWAFCSTTARMAWWRITGR